MYHSRIPRPISRDAFPTKIYSIKLESENRALNFTKYLLNIETLDKNQANFYENRAQASYVLWGAVLINKSYRAYLEL